LQGTSDRLADTTVRFNTFMMTGVGGGRQQVWFRAEVLIRLPDTGVVELVPDVLSAHHRSSIVEPKVPGHCT
jgi:hypothetical protein